VNSGNLNVRDDIVFNDPQGPGYLTGTGQIALKAYNVSPVRGYFDVAWSGAGAQYLTLGNGSQFSQDLQSGNIFTGNIGTYYPQEQTAPLGKVFTNLVSTVTLQANIAITPSLTASAIIASTINGVPFPQGGATPTGGIIIWAGGEPINQWAIPAGWLRCDGTEVSKTTYPALFAVIGNNYQYDKLPSTLDMFFLPDLTFAVPMGAPYANTNGTVNGTVNQVPYLKVYFVPWQTDYVNTPIRQCWKIESVDGQSTAINIGTLFPADGFGAGASGYPNVYVDTILEFDGFVGYIIVCSHDGTTPLPTTNPGAGLEFTARGAGIRADGTYPFQGFNNEGRAKTTRTQQMDEVAPHNHHYFQPALNNPPYSSRMYEIGQPTSSFPNANYLVLPPTSVDPVYNRTSFNATNILSTISTVSLPLKVQNIATTTAPNFVNMSYIIKA
jgi:microcystin-dependent protein